MESSPKVNTTKQHEKEREVLHMEHTKGNCITVLEMAERLKVGRSLAYQLARTASFYPAFRLGSKILISETALERWIDEHSAGGEEFSFE